MSVTATVDRYPNCDLCQQSGTSTPAAYDGKTHMGPWAYMCDPHFATYGIGLGMGIGQRLVLKESSCDS